MDADAAKRAQAREGALRAQLQEMRRREQAKDAEGTREAFFEASKQLMSFFKWSGEAKVIRKPVERYTRETDGLDQVAGEAKVIPEILTPVCPSPLQAGMVAAYCADLVENRCKP